MIPRPSARLVLCAGIPVAVSIVGAIVPGWGSAWIPAAVAESLLAASCLADLAVAIVSGTSSCAFAGARGLALGKIAEITFAVTFRKGARGKAVVSPDQAPGVGYIAQDRTVEAGGKDPVLVSFFASPSRRGPFEIQRVSIATRSFLGLFSLVERPDARVRLSILPSLEALERARARRRRGVNVEFGFRETRRPGEEGDNDGIREYSAGENARRIDWKISARGDVPLVRVRQSSSRSEIVFAVDCGRLMSAERDGRSALDHGLSAMLATADTALRYGDSFHAIAFADEIVAETQQLKSVASMPRLAGFSAELGPRNVESDFLALAARLRSRLRKRSLVVIVTEASDTMPIDAMEKAVAMLSSRHAVVVAFLRDRALELDAEAADVGTLVGFRAAAAAELLEIRDAAATRLRRHASVVVESSDDIAERVIGAYLEAKTRNRI